MAPRSDRWVILLPLVLVLGLILFWLVARPGGDSHALVVYCAHDAVYADAILKEFTRTTGIPVDVRYDTEATKSLGLVNLLTQERHRPRCDVFWNNELLGTVELQSQGLLEPYQGSGWRRIPEKFRDPHGDWVGFGARVRVLIYNVQQVSGEASALQDVVTLETNRAAMARPMFGTTLTHYTALWALWGPDRLRAWHHELRVRGLREVSGNGPVKDIVASGTCAVGWTDTDDAFVALDDNQPVDMVPARIHVPPAPGEPVSALTAAEATLGWPLTLSEDGPNSQTLCIPNSAAIVRGTRHRAEAEKLIDYLASAETELALARSKSRQVPLGPVPEDQLSDEVRRLTRWAEQGLDLRGLLPARRACLEWLKSESLR